MKLPVDRLEDITLAKRAATGAPEIAVGIVAEGELAWFLGAGWADLDSGTRPSEHSLARVASVTKTFTATAVLQLRDRGLLSLDDPLDAHLPEFAQVRERGGRRREVTIRALLTHRSGLVTKSPPTSWDQPSFPGMTEILAALPETAVVVPANTTWKYSNLAFALLGEVVARRSGEPYADYVQEHVVDPLGLAESAFELDERLQALAMTGYQPAAHEDRPEMAARVSLAGLTAAGQLHTNVRDLARWITFHLGAGPASDASVLAPATLAEAQQTLWAQPDFLLGQGLGWRMVRVGDHVFHNHGGSVHGFNSSVGFHVPTGIGVVVLANLWPALVARDLALELLEAIVGRPGRRRRAASAAAWQVPQPTPCARATTRRLPRRSMSAICSAGTWPDPGSSCTWSGGAALCGSASRPAATACTRRRPSNPSKVPLTRFAWSTGAAPERTCSSSPVPTAARRSSRSAGSSTAGRIDVRSDRRG